MKSLASKIVKIMSMISHIEKAGRNQAQNYKYATEADVVAAVRAAMVEVGVAIVPSLKEKRYEPITSKQGASGYLVSVTMNYTVHDTDSDDTFVFEMAGDGMDYGDKGIYKAITGAEKYALLKLFHLPTGDDPEKDSHESAKTPMQHKMTAQAKINELRREGAAPPTPPGAVSEPEPRREPVAEQSNTSPQQAGSGAPSFMEEASIEADYKALFDEQIDLDTIQKGWDQVTKDNRLNSEAKGRLFKVYQAKAKGLKRK